ncbi:MAG: hypothetical protein KAS62_08440, partial [Candidatus Delongbacteria bacterium]|nr:hypothetical protein [Candidatus Delongbacteria bacterium]
MILPKGGNDVSDISNLFWSLAGNPITYTVDNNTNPSVITASLVGSTLTLDASATNAGAATITIKGTTAAKEEITYDFTVYGFDQSDLVSGIEDYETGDFSQYDYTFSGDVNWFVSTTLPYEGTYCAQSGDVGDDQRSDLYLAVDYELPGTLSFYRKVSSEDKVNNNDYLYFFINGSQKDRWNGEVAWSQVTYDVPAGANEFAFIYYKDDRGSAGSDCGWIDYLE